MTTASRYVAFLVAPLMLACGAPPTTGTQPSSATLETDCNPSTFSPITQPIASELVGVWGRTDVVGTTKTTETLTINADATYSLIKLTQPQCSPSLLCPDYEIIAQSTGTYTLAASGDLTLQPTSTTSTSALAISFTVEEDCNGDRRLAGTEDGAVIYLTSEQQTEAPINKGTGKPQAPLIGAGGAD